VFKKCFFQIPLAAAKPRVGSGHEFAASHEDLSQPLRFNQLVSKWMQSKAIVKRAQVL